MIDLEYLFGLEYFGLKLGLDNITAILERLGHPERACATVHVGGTNGKGSVTAMIDAALRASGRRSARFTSPHLVRINERFVVDGRMASDAELEAALTDVREAVDRATADGTLTVAPTFFEAVTAMAFVLFRRAGVAVAVVEVGLGGRLDATNVVAPLAAAIVSIALDHQEHLGATIGEIAREKAGIVKANTPVVIGPLLPDARREIEAVARARQAPLVDAFDGVDVAALGPTPADAQRIRLRTPTHDYGEMTLSLAGAHQVGNAVVAVRTLEALADRGLAVSAEAIARGLAHTEWPGRLETRRLPGGRTVVLDAAHNPAGAQALADALAALPDGPPPIVFGASREKDARGMLAALLPRARALVVTRASNRRAADPEALAAIARGIAPGVPVVVAPAPADALEVAWRIAPAIAVAGSLFLLGDVIPLLS